LEFSRRIGVSRAFEFYGGFYGGWLLDLNIRIFGIRGRFVWALWPISWVRVDSIPYNSRNTIFER
jgi:hypothetical protein